MTLISDLAQSIAIVPVTQRIGTLSSIGSGRLDIKGLGPAARIGDMVAVETGPAGPLLGEVVALSPGLTHVMPMTEPEGARIGLAARHFMPPDLRPSLRWTGRIIDPLGQSIDDEGPLPKGEIRANIKASPPAPATRRPMGARLRTGLGAFDTLLPIARGQRIGIFAGSGVGKSSLLAEIARETEADLVVFALIGERGRELRHFTDTVLGPEGMKRSVIVCATSDQSPLLKRRAGWTAMAVAEALRDTGAHVLLIVDSLTRMAEAHREIALTAGEPASFRGFPPSVSGLISGFAERAGPGGPGQGDITGIFSVLVAGSDMEEPVSDITRGVLDGHIVMDREIAERGRFPAVDVRRSVSRSLPDVATDEENVLIRETRRVLGSYEAAEPMIQSGLYAPGSDALIDHAIRVWPRLDRFFETTRLSDPETAFQQLRNCFDNGGDDVSGT